MVGVYLKSLKYYGGHVSCIYNTGWAICGVGGVLGF